MQELNGRKALEAAKIEIRHKTEKLVNSGKRAPHLSIIRVGDDGASKTYVNHKIKTCEEVGFSSSLKVFPENATEDALLELIREKNNDDSVDGLIVQLPLPKHISEQKVIETISPAKDVDGFHPVNAGRMVKGLPCFLPATPNGILRLIEHYQLETEGKHCVILGRSQIVGLPLSIMLGQSRYPGNATVTLCHSRTANIGEITRQADILVAAIGKPAFVRADMVKKGAVVIDVGITRVADNTKKKGYRLQGDVDYENVAPLTSHITPVPGGVGPMTIAALLHNTLQAASQPLYT